jgi:hypothetical protein
LPQNDKPLKSRDLEEAAAAAYKENRKTAQSQRQNLPPDLAEIVAVWPELPEHIKAAIKALVQTHVREKK